LLYVPSDSSLRLPSYFPFTIAWSMPCFPQSTLPTFMSLRILRLRGLLRLPLCRVSRSMSCFPNHLACSPLVSLRPAFSRSFPKSSQRFWAYVRRHARVRGRRRRPRRWIGRYDLFFSDPSFFPPLLRPTFFCVAESLLCFRLPRYGFCPFLFFLALLGRRVSAAFRVALALSPD